MPKTSANPFAEPSHLPYKLPDFAVFTPEHYRQGFAEGMVEHLAELDALATNPEPASVENTLDAWERAGQMLTRVSLAFGAVKLSDTTDELDAIEEEFAPKLAAHADAIFLDSRLNDRLLELASRADAGEVALDAQADWLLRELIREFTRSGVALGEAEQARLREINGRLAELTTAFESANLKARVAGGIDVTIDDLDGLSDDEVAALRRPDGSLRIELVNTSQQPLLTSLADRKTRQRLMEASLTRGLGTEHDTRPLIVEIARLRAEKATLLGYPHYAALVAARGCAGTTDAVQGMLGRLGPAALASARGDAARLAERLRRDEPDADLAAHDWGWAAEKVRAEEYDLDSDEIESHLPVGKVLDAVYSAANQLYGITFTPRPDLRGHVADADVYEVFNDDGTPIGLFSMDFWARPTKQGGAWMTSLVNQSHLLRTSPVVTNDCNYTPSTTTITWDGVITMFHEFGHALHGLFADSRYPSRSGTETQNDFVEFPSQVNEHWAWQPDVVLPAELIEKLKRAETFNQGFASLESFAAALLDQAWHSTPIDQLPSDAAQVESFERAALDAAGVESDLVPPRYRSHYFAHIFSGDQYAAGYYGYTWAEVMDADAVAWFDESGGGTRENGEHFRRTLLAPGGSVDAMQTYRTFRGRDPEDQPLLARKGLTI